MKVHTATDAVRHLQRTALKLLLSVHDIDCRNCRANKQCELQTIARFLKVGLKAAPYETLLKAQAAQIIQAHVGLCGIMGLKKITGMCEAVYAQNAPWLYCGPIAGAGDAADGGASAGCA
mgnify:CR=1 FL=1